MSHAVNLLIWGIIMVGVQNLIDRHLRVTRWERMAILVVVGIPLAAAFHVGGF